MESKQKRVVIAYNGKKMEFDHNFDLAEFMMMKVQTNGVHSFTQWQEPKPDKKEQVKEFNEVITHLKRLEGRVK